MTELIVAIGGLITAIGGFIAAVWAIVKHYDNKRTLKEKEEKEAKRLEQEREAKLRQQQQIEQERRLLANMKTLIEPLKEANENQEQAIKDIKTQIDENEKDRLRSVVMEFGTKLRNKYSVSELDFTHVHNAYDKYSNMGGNSYVHSEMEFILKKEQEFKDSND